MAPQLPSTRARAQNATNCPPPTRSGIFDRFHHRRALFFERAIYFHPQNLRARYPHANRLNTANASARTAPPPSSPIRICRMTIHPMDMGSPTMIAFSVVRTLSLLNKSARAIFFCSSEVRLSGASLFSARLTECVCHRTVICG